MASPAARIQVGPPNSSKDPKRGFASPSEFLACAMSQPRDPRLEPFGLGIFATAGSDEAGAYSDPAGGFLLPPAFHPEAFSVSQRDPRLGLRRIAMRFGQQSIAARVDKNHATSVSGGLTVARVPETTDATPSRMAFEQIALTATTLLGVAFASERILADSGPLFVDVLAAGFADESAATLLRESLFGGGVGEFLGALADHPARIVVAPEGAQAADTIVAPNLDKMESRVWDYGSAVWLANPETRPQLRAASRVVGTGGSAANFPFEVIDGQEHFDGRPIFFTEEMKALGDLGDIALINWAHYIEATRALALEQSIHVRFAAAERAFRFHLRNDGQPWWRSTLVPRHRTGSYTLSPYVTLDARA